MALRRRVKIQVGKQRLTARSSSVAERHYVAEVNAATKAITDELMNIFKQAENLSEDILIEALEPTGEKALKYTPYDTGLLHSSYYLEKTPFRGAPRVEMGFAKGGNPHYAAIVHEMLDMPHAPPTRAKFLEQALKEDMPVLLTRIRAAYKRFMGL